MGMGWGRKEEVMVMAEGQEELRGWQGKVIKGKKARMGWCKGRAYAIERTKGRGTRGRIKGFRERLVRMDEGEKVRLRQRVVRLRGMAASNWRLRVEGLRAKPGWKKQRKVIVEQHRNRRQRRLLTGIEQRRGNRVEINVYKSWKKYWERAKYEGAMREQRKESNGRIALNLKTKTTID